MKTKTFLSRIGSVDTPPCLRKSIKALKVFALLLVMVASVNMSGSNLSKGDKLFTEAFKGTNTSTTFSATTYSTTNSSITWFTGNSDDASGISFASENAMLNSSTATNMTGAHMWLNKSTSGYVQINDIPLHNVTKFKAYWSQAGAKQVSFSYKFDGESSWTSGGSNSEAGAEVSANEISVTSGKTSVSIKLTRNNNTTNVRVDNISLVAIEVAAACTKSITITKGTTSNGSFTLSQEGDVCIDKGNATVVVTPMPSTHYVVDQVTTNSGFVSGPDADGKYTVSNISASTTINVTFAEKDKVTVTFTDKIHNNNSNRQEYVGDAIQFPAITDAAKGYGCEGEHYHFVGWTKDSSKPNDLVTPASEIVPSTDVEYYAVWAKEAEE